MSERKKEKKAKRDKGDAANSGRLVGTTRKHFWEGKATEVDERRIQEGQGLEASWHADLRAQAGVTIPRAALNESAFLYPAMLSKCKQRLIIYHSIRETLPLCVYHRQCADSFYLLLSLSFSVSA